MHNQIIPDEAELRKWPLRLLRAHSWALGFAVILVLGMFYLIYMIEQTIQSSALSGGAVEAVIWLARMQAFMAVIFAMGLGICVRRLRLLRRVIKDKRAGKFSDDELLSQYAKILTLKGAPMPPKRAKYIIAVGTMELVLAIVFFALSQHQWDYSIPIIGSAGKGYLLAGLAAAFVGVAFIYQGAYWLKHQDQVNVDA